MKLRVFRFDAQKEAVLRRAIEFRNAEKRVMRTRQTVQGKRGKESGEPRAEDGQFECNRNE